MNPASIRLSGAVDLTPKPATPPGGADSRVGVVDVTEASFEAEVLVRSATIPVVIDFWAEWCGPCKTLSPILEKLAAEGAGAWVLAKIDIEANPQLAQAAQVQGIPAVKAVVNGQLVAEFTGALPENQVRQWVDQLLQAARAGTFGPLSGAGPEPAPDGDQAAAEAPVDPDLAAGDEGLMSGDLTASEAAYQQLYDRIGVDPVLRVEASAGLARVALLRRAESLDPQALQDALAANPADVQAAMGLADVLVLSDRSVEAFTVLVDQVRRHAGPDLVAERDSARTRLLSLFELVGDQDPEAVAKARRDLASALF